MGFDGGMLRLGIDWDGAIVRHVSIASTRPQAYALLVGKSPEEAAQMASLLFNVCGKAQGAAAAAALAAAQGQALPDRLQLQRRIACEALQEHLWRLLLDWPKALGQPSRQAEFVRWYGLLREIAEGQGDMAALLEDFETKWLGSSAGRWQNSNLQALRQIWTTSGSPAALLLAELHREVSLTAECDVALLPDWTAAQALAACGDQLDSHFSAQPHWQGEAAETGAISAHLDTPLLEPLCGDRRSRLLARVLARVLDALQIMTASDHNRLDAVRMDNGAGLSVVRTARGMLLHRARVEAGKVSDYLTVAPTEWNFHPNGALAAWLRGAKFNHREALMQRINLEVLSLDPCVPFEIALKGSADA